jgi:hypothetical protein
MWAVYTLAAQLSGEPDQQHCTGRDLVGLDLVLLGKECARVADEMLNIQSLD